MRVGLTGGIASGKSVAAETLRQLGLVVIDYDRLARQAIDGSALAKVVEAFGVDILGSDGKVDRLALAELVFADASVRQKLESIIHPLVYQAAAEEEATAIASGQSLIIHEIPLLTEVGDVEAFDIVILVDAPAELRLQRLIEDRKLTPIEAKHRLEAQASDDQRRAVADVIWNGAASEAELRAQVKNWVQERKEDEIK